MRKLITIHSKDEGYSADIIEDDDGSIFFVGDMDMDWDGIPGKWNEDPCGRAEVAVFHNGKPINGDKVPAIVLPREAFKVFKKVKGCKARVSYKGRECDAVVYDVGPSRKLGEGSPELARRLGINPHHTKGGTSKQEVTYRFWPGVPAVVDGVTFKLQ